MHACLAHRTVREARVQAFQRHIINGFRGGLVVDDADAKLRHRRHNVPCDSPSQEAHYPNRISGEFIYGGPIVTHFGHFMAETVHRIVPSMLLHGEAHFVFVSEAGPRAITSFPALPGFARDVLQLLGLKAGTVRLIGENTVVEQLFAVEQGSEWGFGPKPGYLDDLRDYVTPRLDERYRAIRRPAKIYVSRARMPGGKFLGEHYLEEQLAAEGFAIVHPETLPVTVQMDLYRKADILVFPDGSACHGVELLGTGALGRCCLLVRRKSGAEIFQKILKSRSAEFIVSGGHPFIGTKFMHPITQQPLTRLGVSLFNARELVSSLRQGGIARLPNFVEREYLRAAEHDLLRYHREISLPGPVGRWIRRLLGKRRGPPVRPGAQSALNQSFRKHAVVK